MPTNPQRTTQGERIAIALERFGWNVREDADFWRRYNTDVWVYNLVNALVALGGSPDAD